MKTITCQIPSLLDAAALTGQVPDGESLAKLNDPLVSVEELLAASAHLRTIREEHLGDAEQMSRRLCLHMRSIDPVRVQAIAYRLNALYMLLQDEVLKPWVRLNKRTREATIDEEVLQAAVLLPLSMQSREDEGLAFLYIGFDREQLFSLVKQFDDGAEAIAL